MSFLTLLFKNTQAKWRGKKKKKTLKKSGRNNKLKKKRTIHVCAVWFVFIKKNLEKRTDFLCVGYGSSSSVLLWILPAKVLIIRLFILLFSRPIFSFQTFFLLFFLKKKEKSRPLACNSHWRNMSKYVAIKSHKGIACVWAMKLMDSIPHGPSESEKGRENSHFY